MTTMARSKRFKPIVKLAQNSERDAAKALGEALKRLNDNVHQLHQLHLYQEEYHQRLHSDGSQGMSAQQMNEYRGFLAKITAAIESQEKAIETAKLELEEKKQFWFAKRGRSKALDKVLDRYVEEESRQQERRLQKEIDDRASRKHES